MYIVLYTYMYCTCAYLLYTVHVNMHVYLVLIRAMYSTLLIEHVMYIPPVCVHTHNIHIYYYHNILPSTRMYMYNVCIYMYTVCVVTVYM